jgi:hypothetical protein
MTAAHPVSAISGCLALPRHLTSSLDEIFAIGMAYSVETG